VDPETLMRNAKKRKQTKEERLADIQSGREGREKYGSNKGDKQRGSTSNRVRPHARPDGCAPVRLSARLTALARAVCRRTSRTSSLRWCGTSATSGRSSSGPCATSRHVPMPPPTHIGAHTGPRRAVCHAPTPTHTHTHIHTYASGHANTHIHTSMPRALLRTQTQAHTRTAVSA
jgi:hypothetical protein